MSFDLEDYQATARPVRVDDIDFGAFRTRPLPEEALRALRYMHDVESHTVCYLRDLLLTASHKDPRITTFLTMWNYEEHFHGVAIGKVLEAHGEASEAERIAPMRARNAAKERLAPFGSMLGSALLGEDFVAVHMTWGAVNEWSTQTAYDRLIALADHPVLTTLLTRIARQEARHIAFYATEARTRLARSAKARRATRLALQRLWAPVGSAVMPEEETTFLLGYLLGDETGRAHADRIDRRVRALPGLDGLTIVSDAMDRLLGPVPAPPVALAVAA
jgi:hypothetical protein